MTRVTFRPKILIITYILIKGEWNDELIKKIPTEMLLDVFAAKICIECGELDKDGVCNHEKCKKYLSLWEIEDER